MESLLAAIFGLTLGSFYNVLIDRLPLGESVIAGRSHCDYCKKTLRWFELLPLLSFIIQKGACRRCHKKLSWQYPAIETITGIGFFIITQHLFYANPFAWIYTLVLFSVCLVLIMADLKFFILPDSMIIVGILATSIYGVTQGISAEIVINHFLAASTASLFFFLLWFGTKGKGMGFGDVKLAFFIGLVTGLPGMIISLYVSFLTGAGIGVILLLIRSRTLKSRIPFGPFLLCGLLITYIWGNQIWQWWRHFMF